MLLHLPHEIIVQCCEYLSPADIYKMRYFLYPLHAIKTFFDRVTYIKTSFPISIVRSIGFEHFLSFPILEWKNDFIGFTDYIDRIRPSDLSHPVMIGIDCYQRSFITLKLYNKEGVFVNTLFQRYTNDKNTWTHGKCGYSTIINDSGYFLNSGRWKNETLKNILFDLCNNRFIIIYQRNNIYKSFSLAD